MTEAISAELFCPECGYDLRGIDSGRCPECGGEIDRSHLGQSLLPWRHRQRLGIIRAFIRTVTLASFRPKVLAREMNTPASFADAVRFRRIVCLLALIPVGLLVSFVLWESLYDRSEPWLSQDPWGSIFQLIAFGVLWLCLWLYLLATSGVASYFYHPPSLDLLRQNRAIALSYYTCAPLAFTPLTIGLLVAAVNSHIISSRLPIVLQAAEVVIVAAPIVIQLYLLFTLPGRLLGLITHRDGGWKVGFAFLLGVLRLLLAIPILVILPAIYIVLMLMALSLVQ